MGRILVRAALHTKVGRNSAKLVLLALADLAPDDTGVCTATLRDITEWTELSSSQVCVAIQHLADRGLLTRSKGGGRSPNQYILTLPEQEPEPSVDVRPSESSSPAIGAQDWPVYIDIKEKKEVSENLLLVDESITEEEAQCLSLLETVSGYPFDREKDLRQIRRTSRLHPDVDMLALIEKLTAWWEEDHKRLRKNPRLSIVTWAQQRWAPKRCTATAPEVASDDEWNRRVLSRMGELPSWWGENR